MTYIEAAMLALENQKLEDTTPEEEEKSEEKQEASESLNETKDDSFTDKDKDPWNLELFEKKSETDIKDSEKSVPRSPMPKTRVHNLKPQRSLSVPSPMGRFNRPSQKNVLDRKHLSLKSQIIINTEPLASDTYLYFILWACVGMIFWKNISLMPLLPLPILIYVLKHVGIYLGLWKWIGGYFKRLGNAVYDWCSQRYDALVPAPIRGLYKISLKINSNIKDGIRDSIDTVSSVVVISGLIVFMTCASIFFAIQVFPFSNNNIGSPFVISKSF